MDKKSRLKKQEPGMLSNSASNTIDIRDIYTGTLVTPLLQINILFRNEGERRGGAAETVWRLEAMVFEPRRQCASVVECYDYYAPALRRPLEDAAAGDDRDGLCGRLR